jgi:adenylosuccinate lyase
MKLNDFEAFSVEEIEKLRSIYKHFTVEHAEKVKSIEKITNHDVKAVEYFIKEQCNAMQLQFNFEYIHFGLTSQDINNTSFPLMFKRFLEQDFIPKIENLMSKLELRSQEWKQVALIAKTHGQPATPTTLGKEFYVFYHRLELQIKNLKEATHYAKFGGATGNLNAHKVTFSSMDWVAFANRFVASLGLERQQVTTQIEHYDGMAAIMDNSKRIQNILIDLARDVWSYISFDFFKQKIKENEVGSSAMPHKVNPIDFENAEGNLMYSNAVLEFLSSKLPISRLQRDLTDSTVLRNIGVPYAHGIIALNSLEKGIDKLLINEEKITADIYNNWLVIAEGIQNVLRREGVEKPYELLKEFTRKNHKPSPEDFENFIEELPVNDIIKAELKLITPFNYIGYANEMF